MRALPIEFSDLYADKKNMPALTFDLQWHANIFKLSEIEASYLPTLIT